MPNRLSHQCINFEELRETLVKVLSGELDTIDGSAIIDHYRASTTGPMACERIVDVLEQISTGLGRSSAPSFKARLEGCIMATTRRFSKLVKAYLPDSHNRTEFHRHRYPEIPAASVRKRVFRIKDCLGDRTEIMIEQISNEIFQIAPK